LHGLARTCSDGRVHEPDHPSTDGPQSEDVPVDVTPGVPRPRSRRRLWPAVTATAVLGAAGFGVAFADNFAGLGAYRYSPPQDFDGLRLDPKASRSKAGAAASDSGVSATGYLGDTEHRMVFLTVSEQHIFVPASALDDLLARQRSNGLALTDLHDVDPGDRGGVMKCGTTTSEGHPIAVCDWADGSMWGTFNETAETGTTPEQAAIHARAFRSLAEVPS
jgi:hypothetical protein